LVGSINKCITVPMNVFTCSVSDCFEIGSEVLYWIVWRKIKYRTDLDSLPDCFGETTCFFITNNKKLQSFLYCA